MILSKGQYDQYYTSEFAFGLVSSIPNMSPVRTSEHPLLAVTPLPDPLLLKLEWSYARF